MTDATRTMIWRRGQDDPRALLDREWLVTNGLGGYASGPLSSANTRRYPGLLIAALAGNYGRTLMLGHLSDRLRVPDGAVFDLGGEGQAGGRTTRVHGADHLTEFRLEHGLPVWTFELP